MKKIGAVMRIKSTLLFMGLAVMLVCGVTISTGYADDYDEGGVSAEEFREAEQQANTGDAQAQFYLGLLYRDGLGVAEDAAKAAYWYEKAASQGNVEAQRELAFMYDLGSGIVQDYAKANYWFEKAADQGDVSALYALGMRYYDGVSGVSQDKQKGCTLLKDAADLKLWVAIEKYNQLCQ